MTSKLFGLMIVLAVVALWSVPCMGQEEISQALRRWWSGVYYSDAYVKKNKGKALVEIPEVFELANIAIAISEEGLRHPNRVRKKGAYYEPSIDR
jgi:hypothetical protein